MNRSTEAAPSTSNRDETDVVFGVIACVAFVAYFTGLHVLVADRRMPSLALAMILVPWIAASIALAAKRYDAASGARRAAIVTIASVLVVAVVLLASDRWRALVAKADVVLYVENALFFAWLSALFAFSLASPREALVTRMARKVRRGDMPPEVVRYTRRVTMGWALLFASTIVVSSVLFFDGSRTAWSLFVNLLIWPLIVAAFVVEYAIRRTVLRHVRHVPLMSGVQAFRQRDLGDPDLRR